MDGQQKEDDRLEKSRWRKVLRLTARWVARVVLGFLLVFLLAFIRPIRHIIEDISHFSEKVCHTS